MTAVGGGETPILLFDIPARAGQFQLASLPVAFAAHADVPHLLGWIGFFDQLSVIFHPNSRETSIPPADLPALENLRTLARSAAP